MVDFTEFLLFFFVKVTLEESTELPLALLIPEDGFSCDVVRGIPPGLVDFVSPLQAAGMCRLAAQPTSIGLWTVYMHQYNVSFRKWKTEKSLRHKRRSIDFLYLLTHFLYSSSNDRLVPCQVNIHNLKYSKLNCIKTPTEWVCQL